MGAVGSLRAGLSFSKVAHRVDAPAGVMPRELTQGSKCRGSWGLGYFLSVVESANLEVTVDGECVRC